MVLPLMDTWGLGVPSGAGDLPAIPPTAGFKDFLGAMTKSLSPTRPWEQPGAPSALPSPETPTRPRHRLPRPVYRRPSRPGTWRPPPTIPRVPRLPFLPPASAISSAARAPTTPPTMPAPIVAAPALADAPAQVDPATPATSTTAMRLEDYPRPPNDNGRGMHWVPTTAQHPSVVDRFVPELAAMNVRWSVFLNDGTNVGGNDYLVKKLVEKGIEPVLRVYTPDVTPLDPAKLQKMVQHYGALGARYFQLYNEPNLNAENGGRYPDVDRYLNSWIPAARAVAAAGGLPGFGALSPGGNYDDVAFFKRALDGIKARGATDALDHAWVSMHNYTLNHPVDYLKDSNGFLKFRWYDQIVREKLGRSLPIVGTEGGTYVGNQDDKTLPVISKEKQVDMVVDAYRYMADRREPYNLAYTYWIVANEEGGGLDKGFSHQALFKPGEESPVIAAVRKMPAVGLATGPRPHPGPVPKGEGTAVAARPLGKLDAPAVDLDQRVVAKEEGTATVTRAMGKFDAPPGGVATRAELGARVVAIARQLLGQSYVWGGHAPGGFDCTGLTWYVYKEAGHPIPQHDLPGQMRSGPPVVRDALRPGDLTFFQNTYQPGLSHVGIYVGGGQFLHAASEQKGIIISSLSEPYWAARYVGATRPS